MKIIITGGGTGGHIYPGITLATTLKSMDPSHEILFVGTERGLEADVVPRAGFELRQLNLSGIPRCLSPQLFLAIIRAGKGMLETVQLLREFRPDVVVGTGGYVCGPVVLTAALMGIPTLIQEQNAFPGITNKILGRFVKRVCLGYEEASRYFPRHKVKVTGNPIRPEIGSVPRAEAAARLGISPDKTTMLVFGASQGARSINKALLEALPQLMDGKNLQVLWLTGRKDYDKLIGELKRLKLSEFQEMLHVWPYLYNMPDAYAVSDWVVGRAGAISLAEITCQGLPAILVPYPYATGDHQTWNARVLAAAGAGWSVPDKEFTGERLLELVEKLADSPSLRKAMGAASRALGKPMAARDLAEEAIALGTSRLSRK
jgi:UDP-N-acetylglucosamine--N-acetylmuramyl-(pentapeptide) pyrophosphoryl-undecaprenol N-acetylglucosamine transferase